MSAMSVVASPTTRLCPSMLRKGKWEWRFRLADEANEVGVRWVSGGCSPNTHLRFSLCTRAFPKIEVGVGVFSAKTKRKNCRRLSQTPGSILKLIPID